MALHSTPDRYPISTGDVSGRGNANIGIGHSIFNIDGADMQKQVEKFKEFLKHEPLRAFLGFLEILESLLSFALIIVTGCAITGMTSDLGWSRPPGKLIYNIILAVFTLVGFLLSVAWKPLVSHDDNARSWQLLRLIIHVLAMVAWIIASALAWYTCSDICSAAYPNTQQWMFAGICCDCSQPTADKLFNCAYFGTSYPRRGLGSLRRRHSIEQRWHLYETTQGLDITMAILFLASSLASAVITCVGPRARRQ